MASSLVRAALIPNRYTNGCCIGRGCGNCSCCYDIHCDQAHTKGDPSPQLRWLLTSVPPGSKLTSLLQLEPFTQSPAIQALFTQDVIWNKEFCVYVPRGPPAPKLRCLIKLPSNYAPPATAHSWNPCAPNSKEPWRIIDGPGTLYWDSWYIQWQQLIIYHFKRVAYITGPRGHMSVRDCNGLSGLHPIPPPVFYLLRANHTTNPHCDSIADHYQAFRHSNGFGRRIPCRTGQHGPDISWALPTESWMVSSDWFLTRIFSVWEKSAIRVQAELHRQLAWKDEYEIWCQDRKDRKRAHPDEESSV